MRTDYDGQGRITSTRTANGFETRYQYQTVLVSGLNGSSANGTKKTSFEADGRSSIDQIDYFGHTTWHRDLGGTEYSYNYDAAARLVRQTSSVHTGQSKGQDIRYTYYANGYIQSATDVSAGTRSEYGYDAAGNRVSEGYYQWDGSARIASYQNATITYDELNRVARVRDMNYFDIRYEYDAVGNRRLVESVYWDGVAGLRNKQVYWYAYDVMNRFTVTKGALSGARATSKTDTSVNVVAGTEGTTLGYDKQGQRRVADYTYNGTFLHETYGYSQDGYLQTITQGSTLKDVRVLDGLGRTKEQHDKQNQTVTTSIYDADNRVLSQRYTDAKDGNKNNTTAYSYYTDTSDTGSNQTGKGALARTVTTLDSGSATTTTYTYDHWDEAKQKSIVKSGVTTGSTTLSYNANGHLLSAFDAAAKLTTNYFNSANGLILKRERQQVNGSGVTKVGSHFYYYADGKRVGDVSDDPNDDPRLSYAEALARKAQDPQDKKDLYKNFKPVTSADFDQNYQPINDNYPGAVGGTYTVRGGETLQAVAQTLWGDGSQWYLIAEANGLIGLETLTEGQVLVIPNKVTNIHNNNSTVRPYSAGEAIGNIDPTLPAPPPPPKHGCGGLGMVLMIVVAVVVTVYTAGAAAGYLGAASTAAGATGTAAIGGAALSGGGLVAGAGGFALGSSAATVMASAAIGGAVGSIASQGLAMAMNMQESFSWKQVGQAALGGAVTAGIGQMAQAGGMLQGLQGSGAWASAGRAALSSGANQALRGHWSWREIVASAVGAGAGAAAGNAIGNSMGSVGRGIAAGFVGGVAGQWAGPGGKANYGSTFASTLGSVLGDQIAGGMASDRNLSNGNYRNEMDRESDAYSPVFNYNYRNGSDVESDIAYDARRAQDEYTGGRDFAAYLAGHRRVTNEQAPAGADSALPGVPASGPMEEPPILGWMSSRSNRFDTRLPILGPSTLAKPDGSPGTYTFDRSTGEVYWDLGKENTVHAIPLAYKRPTWDEAVNDPSNPWAQGPRMGNVLADAALFTAGGVAGMFTGGWAFAAMRGAGYGLLGAGATAGVVGDLTAQAGDNLAWLASDGQLGRSGINGTELAISAGLGALPGLPGAIRGWAGDLRGLGVPDWNIRFASRQPGVLYSNPLPFELVARESGPGLRAPFVDFDAVDALAPGLYRADPQQLRFMQPTVSPNYSVGGHTIASTADDLRLGRVTPDDLGDPLRVVMHEGKPFSFDNRRLLSYSLADVREAPIQVMGLDDPLFARRVDARFDPINGQGLRVVVATSRERPAAMADLYQRGMIQRPR